MVKGCSEFAVSAEEGFVARAEAVYNVYLIMRRLSSYFFVQNGEDVSLSRWKH